MHLIEYNCELYNTLVIYVLQTYIYNLKKMKTRHYYFDFLHHFTIFDNMYRRQFKL